MTEEQWKYPREEAEKREEKHDGKRGAASVSALSFMLLNYIYWVYGFPQGETHIILFGIGTGVYLLGSAVLITQIIAFTVESKMVKYGFGSLE